MKDESLRLIISRITHRALWEVRNVFECVAEDMLEKSYCGMPLWKHIYHMLHSLDQWFINPAEYEDPEFHTPDLNNLDVRSEGTLGRDRLTGYFLEIEVKIEKYLLQLEDKDLLTRPEGCKWTRFELIMGQHRHLATHMGMIMGYITAETGKWPLVLGLEREVPPEGFGSFM